MERNLTGFGGHGRVLGDGLNHPELFHVLEGVTVSHLRAAHAAHREDRRACRMGCRDAAERIRMPGCAGYHRDTWLPRDAAPPVRHVNGSRFVPRVGDHEPLALGDAEDLVQVITHQGEDVGDTEFFEAGDE